MHAYKNLYCPIRIVVGAIIATHGLIRIADISSYIEFVLASFSEVVPSENILILGSALFPFLEFFTGLLIVFGIKLKKAIWMAFFISIVMSTFILFGNMYERLLYHSIVLLGLIIIRIFMKSPHTRHWA